MENVFLSERSHEILEANEYCLKSDMFEKVELPLKTLRKYKYKIKLNNDVIQSVYFLRDSLEDFEIVLFEVLVKMSLGKTMEQLEQLTLREVDFYLRDVNSKPSISEDFYENPLAFDAYREVLKNHSCEYEYNVAQMGNFKDLILPLKIKEVQKCLSYYNLIVFEKYNINIRLVEIDDLLIVLSINNREFRDEILDELHQMFIEVFQDDNINVINEV